MLFEKEKIKLTEKQEVNLSTSSNQKSVFKDENKDKTSKFEVLEKIGEGGYGLVYKVKRLDDDKFYALKLLKIDLESDKAALKRFQLEAKNLAKLSHKNLVSIDDQGFLDNGTPYILMEYFESVSLSQHIKDSGGKLKFETCIEIFRQVCQGVEAIHNKAIIHRDLTPKNILIQENENGLKVKLVDFGIAKTLPSASATTQGFTETGKVFGTPDYMSPEQCMSLKLSKSADIYSIGCCLYEALTGSPPFKGTNAIETMLMHTESKPKALDNSIPNSKITNRIILKTLEKKPYNRYGSAKRLQTELTKLVTNQIKFGPLFPIEKYIGATTIALLALCLLVSQFKPNNNTNTTNRSRSAIGDLSARSLIEPLPEIKDASSSQIENRIKYITDKTREAGKRIEAPWNQLLMDSLKNSFTKDKGALAIKNHNEARLTSIQAVAEATKLGRPAIPYVSQYLNDDVRLVRDLSKKTIMAELPFPTKTLARAMINYSGTYYEDSFKLLAYGGSESVEVFCEILAKGRSSEKEKAISLIALTMMSANRNMEISNQARDNLINALNDDSLRNRHLIPSILIIFRSEDPVVKKKIDNLLLNDKDEKVRMASASALGYYLNQPFINDRNNTLIVLDKSVKSDPSQSVRLSSISNLSADYDQDSKVKPYLESYLSDPDIQIKYAARTSLDLLNLKKWTIKNLSIEQRNSIYSHIRADKPLTMEMVTQIAQSSESNIDRINLSKDSVIGIELPLIIHRLTKTNESYHIISSQKAKYIGIQTWILSAGYNIRRSSSRASYAKSLYLDETVRYKHYYSEREY